MGSFEQLVPSAGLNTYEADWFSGSQVQVMIGDILIDNAVRIYYQVNQNKLPVYGFGSQYFKCVGSGPIVVAGQLSISFKESGYLLRAISDYYNRMKKGLGVSPRYAAPTAEANMVGAGTLLEASNKAKNGRVVVQNVEQMINNLKDGFGSKTGLITQLSALPDDAFEDYAEEFEDALWFGSEKSNPTTRGSLYSRNIRETENEITPADILCHRRVDQYPAVDIWITYGDMEAPDGVNHTVQKLLDVHFVGESKTIETTGDVILESYEFIARNRV